MSLIGKSIGNYRITGKLGEGGMGTVYLGEHPLIGKRVAVKVLLDELSAKEDIISRFFNEAKAVNDIGHQNIVDIVDFGRTTDEGRPVVYFIMEFLDGESLASRLRRTGLTFPETLHVMIQCCSALAASHSKNIVHRDLKPDNIFLCPRGADRSFVKILDFGIAKLTGDGPGSSAKTRTGLVIGTPWYMSPEQCEGKGLIDHRSDVYSLGVVMYELLTGRVPFPGDGFGEVLVAQMTQLPKPPSHVNPQIRPELEAIVMRAMEKDRNARFQSMAEFGQALERIGGPVPSAWHNPGPTAVLGPPKVTTLSGAASEVTQAPGRRKRAVALAVVGSLMVIAAGGVIAVKAGLVSKGGDKPVIAEPQPPVETPKPVEKAVAQPVADEHPEIEITVTSDPPGAHVLRADQGGRDVGTTPVALHSRKGDPSFDIQLRLDGYKMQTREVVPRTTMEIIVAMTKEMAAPPTVNEARPVVAAKSRPQSHTATKHHEPAVSKPKGTATKGTKPEKEFELIKPKAFD